VTSKVSSLLSLDILLFSEGKS